ncbi:transcriptional regulator [Pseudomonas syringae pv. actinidifoliorum]|uniref:helix-turn-helix domain-containing protein n=1 Tax=Pseudomonas syringae TaxID=317 RepID=UPI001372669C|nr:helix-turn-helix transcriptional regulator [Pseudomonas syringae]NAS97441.1 transcriptional regulator [Pseudomonas syringae pv. actinidifoliorum]NAT62646.1 transcriptional regulator [Pseudomonas syringae pv. actinidifoliorum]
MKDIQISLGERVRLLRTALGFSQEGLAHATGLHRTYIGSVERGERNLSLQNIVIIARALSTTPSNLLEGIK